jgi:hypothetical protein
MMWNDVLDEEFPAGQRCRYLCYPRRGGGDSGESTASSCVDFFCLTKF